MNVSERIWGVSELTREIKQTLESAFPPLWLKGELSGVLLHRSGHLYLTLKDAGSQIKGVMWRQRVRGLDFRPEDGLEVLLFGRVVVYERGGQYQFDIEVMQPAGRGALWAEFEKLRVRLEAEGLFAAGRKRP
ncbi:MAG TPA: exodeoxyribonuclease VII large subunit, partial [Bacteroidetes bacterium]|nr:exodeoxyribonuclease VII large subunit [Bacteroidota bacterium]